jgi:glycosyltransferase involved in cell wall biosynthesis
MDVYPRVFMPRFLDAGGHNAQNINARYLLASFAKAFRLTTVHYGDVAKEYSGIGTQARLIPTRLWQIHMLLRYLHATDMVFYPGHEWYDAYGLKARKALGRKSFVVATLEGIPFLESTAKSVLQSRFGHDIHAMSQRASEHYHEVLKAADHVIAISPFLAEVGTYLYGDKFSVLPLGVDRSLFHPERNPQCRNQPSVVCAGTIYDLKRPQLFLRAAEAMPDVMFTWYGAARGALYEELLRVRQQRKLMNLEFPGPVSAANLADAFRRADLFVLPSRSEGVPKVSQEAAACGLPQVLFGHYESPTVINGVNGRVVWNDDEFIGAIRELLDDPQKRLTMGCKSAEMAADWGWDVVAGRWVEHVANLFRLRLH